MRVLLIPEDFRKDQYILKPLFSRLFRNLGKRSAKVMVCRDPLLGGVTEALKSDRIAEITQRYQGMIDVFILCIDRDGEAGRRQRLDQIEEEFGDDTFIFLGENAWEEVETWVLAGVDLPRDWRWDDIRAEVQVKEEYFEPLAELQGLSDYPGGGRKELAEAASHKIPAIRRKCVEDFDALAKRLERHIAETI